MKNKAARLQSIREIIIHSRVKSQEEILQKLIEQGFDLTQATLSRDLKQLRIAKVPGNDGSYVYIMPEIGSVGKLMQEKMGDNPQRHIPGAGICRQPRLRYRQQHPARSVGNHCRRRYRAGYPRRAHQPPAGSAGPVAIHTRSLNQPFLS